MKKKIFVCTLLVLFIFLTCTTALAQLYNFEIPRASVKYSREPLYFSVNMRAKDTNNETYHIIEGEHVICSHRACLVQGTAKKSSELAVPSGSYKYIYPSIEESMDLSLRVRNPYSDYIMKSRGNFRFTINSRCEKRPWGYLGVLAVSALDVTVYSFFVFPTGFFPSEYATVESAMLVTSDTTLNIVISIMYWLILIAATGFVYIMVNKHDKKGDNGYETHYCG